MTCVSEDGSQSAVWFYPGQTSSQKRSSTKGVATIIAVWLGKHVLYNSSHGVVMVGFYFSVTRCLFDMRYLCLNGRDEKGRPVILNPDNAVNAAADKPCLDLQAVIWLRVPLPDTYPFA